MLMPQEKGAPRVCGDDPFHYLGKNGFPNVLPAYAGMIPGADVANVSALPCAPRMRG